MNLLSMILFKVIANVNIVLPFHLVSSLLCFVALIFLKCLIKKIGKVFIIVK